MGVSYQGKYKNLRGVSHVFLSRFDSLMGVVVSYQGTAMDVREKFLEV